VLRVEERPTPQPGPGQVRIAVEAAGLNYSDLLARMGLYPDSPKTPCVLGYEVAGTVDAVGEGVVDLRAGDRVVAATRFTGQAEIVVAGADETVAMPHGMPMAEGAAIPINYGTAYAALVLMAGVHRGDRVLVHSAAGGVGTAMTQLAHHYGAMVIGTASAAKHASVLEQGADHVIDYRTQDVTAEVHRITDGQGVDVILDAVGPSSLRRDWRLLRPGGRVIAYGVTSLQTGERRNLPAALRTVAAFPFATMPWWKGPRILNENKGVFGLNLLHWWDDEGSIGRIVRPLRELVESGVVRPVVDSTFSFDRAADAHRRLMSGKSIGKVVLTPH